MTIACCWLNTAHGRSRITAIADARASIGPSAVSDDTVKLLPIALKCHEASNFDYQLERFVDPYFKTELGIAYAGDCFSAFNIIVLLSRALSQLASEQTGALPEAKGVATAFHTLIEAFFAKAQGDTQKSTVQFLLFGYDPQTGEPWVAEFTRRHPGPTDARLFPAIGPKDFFCIGDGVNAHGFLGRVKGLRSHIQGHAEDLVVRAEEDAEFKREMEAARHEVAEKKVIEEHVLELIESSFATTIGGELQKLELYPNGASALACQTAAPGYHILRTLPVMPSGLQFPTVNEWMGRKPPL